jgi:hypothetical protein
VDPRAEKTTKEKNYQACRGDEYEDEQRTYAQGRIIIDPIEQFTCSLKNQPGFPF